MNIRLLAGAAVLAASLQPLAAQASTPASDNASVPTKAGESTVISWTGTALPGASGASSACVAGGPDDSHDVVLTVPAGTYDSVNVTAAFHIEWTPGTSNGVTTDPDLVLSVAQDGTVLASSDGSGAEENVTLSNPTAGTLTAIVCPFFASGTTDYKATLTLTAKAGVTCVNPPTTAKANAVSVAAPNAKVDPEHSGLIDIDQFRSQSWNRLVALPTSGYEGRRQSSTYDRVLGVPTFLWASNAAKPIAVGALANTHDLLAASARVQLRNEAKKLKLTDAMIDQAEVVNAQYNGNGPAVVRLRQRVNGYEVYHRYLNVLFDRGNVPVATSGYFASGYGTPSTAFALTAPQAIAKAWAALGGTLNPLSLVLASTQGPALDGYERYSLKTALVGSHRFEREPRSRRMYYATADGKLVPAYYIELFSIARLNRNLSAYALVVSAADGSILHRENLKASEVAANAAAPGATSKPFTYRMFAETSFPFMLDDEPLGNGYTPFPATDRSATITRKADPALPRLVTLAYGPINTQDAWLTDDATATTGNNVDACLDLNDTAVDGTISTPLNTCDSNTLGDYRAAPSADHTFDYTATPDQDPSTAAAKGGAVVSLFYLNNWLHDWWYNHGFDEASGNAQTSNYGRGGTEGDAIHAQGQDASGRNNANMSTPADGSSPTMQQYLFDGPITGEVRETMPADSGPLKFSGASFGPTTFDVTGTAVLAADATGTSNTDGCGVAVTDPTGALPVPIPTTPAPPQASLAGNIALVDRGSCNFTVKEQFATVSGASALVVINNVDSDPITMGNADVPVTEVPVSPTDMVYQTPAVMIRKADGDKLKAALAAGMTITMHVQRLASIDRDGTLDNQVVGHEFFHYVHHRLTDSTNQQANAMSEGWGDTDAMMISVRENDLSAPDNDHWQGAYDLAGYVIDNFYNGIRRAPYSTDAKKNAFTLKHIADGTATPDGGAGASNSEVHNAGEIWANEMWNCYAGILNTANNGTFGEKQLRMQDYIIGGFKMTPADATYTEARDAIIGTVLAGGNFADYKACSDGFAAKGNGLYAVAPARDSTDLTGVTEDYTPFVCAKAGGTTGGGTGSTVGGTVGGIVSGTASGAQDGRLGGGAFGLLLLIPGFLLAAGRRRR